MNTNKQVVHNHFMLHGIVDGGGEGTKEILQHLFNKTLFLALLVREG